MLLRTFTSRVLLLRLWLHEPLLPFLRQIHNCLLGRSHCRIIKNDMCWFMNWNYCRSYLPVSLSLLIFALSYFWCPFSNLNHLIHCCLIGSLRKWRCKYFTVTTRERFCWFPFSLPFWEGSSRNSSTDSCSSDWWPSYRIFRGTKKYVYIYDKTYWYLVSFLVTKGT